MKNALFVSDNHGEVVAATNAEMNAVIAVRKGNKELPDPCNFSTYTNFTALLNDYQFCPFS